MFSGLHGNNERETLQSLVEAADPLRRGYYGRAKDAASSNLSPRRKLFVVAEISAFRRHSFLDCRRGHGN